MAEFRPHRQVWAHPDGEITIWLWVEHEDSDPVTETNGAIVQIHGVCVTDERADTTTFPAKIAGDGHFNGRIDQYFSSNNPPVYPDDYVSINKPTSDGLIAQGNYWKMIYTDDRWP